MLNERVNAVSVDQLFYRRNLLTTYEGLLDIKDAFKYNNTDYTLEVTA